jgi:pimeloyl-ACP methyl ester carboxylesterase
VLDKYEIDIGRFAVPIATAGDAGDPVIVVVNGAQQTMASARSLVRHFRPRGFRVVLFDFPGQGRGRFLHGPPRLQLMEQVEVTAAVIRAGASGTPVNVIGGSWGAVVAAATSAMHPELVGQLVLGSFCTAANPALLQIARRGRRYIDEGSFDLLGGLFVDGFGAGLPETRKAQIREQMRGLSREHAHNLYHQSFLFADGADIAQHVDLGDIRARTLIVNGELDPIVDEGSLHAAARRIPDCTGILVPGVGHFLHNEAPDVLWVYERFFRGFTPRSVDASRTTGHVRTPAA